MAEKQYVMSKDAGGTVRYRLNGKLVSKNDIPKDALEALHYAPAGTVVDEMGNSSEPGDGLEGPSRATGRKDIDKVEGEDEEVADDATPDESAEPDEADAEAEVAPEDAAREDELAKRRAARKAGGYEHTQTPQSDPGMGFPRKGGYTVDIFDGETPHTHIRNVPGVPTPVPLKEENYKTKTDGEIIAQLKKLGIL